MKVSVLKDLPAVHEVLESLRDLSDAFPRALIVAEVRAVIAAARARIAAEPDGMAAVPDIPTLVRRSLREISGPSLRPVINATGVVLHTNLGRAPLPALPLASVGGYTNLEYDLASGKRGRRDTHLDQMLRRLLGVPGIAVNNNAAAVYLVLNELASGGEAIVSRGELIEIGDGFRIPDIMARSGAQLREVGTTNRTRIEDYRDAINERTRLIMLVHPSNFRIQGFTAKPARRELTELARSAGVPLYEDLGSGCLADMRPWGVDEPRVQDSFADGVPLVSFSGDKLLGGPQAGIIAGEAAMVARLRRNPMFRALRLDKLIVGALEATLRYTLLEQWDQLPALGMIARTADSIRVRAERIAALIGNASVIAGESVIGGGSTPEQSIPTWLIAIGGIGVSGMEQRLRQCDPPVVARMEDGRLLLDLRTVAGGEEQDLVKALNYARSR